MPARTSNHSRETNSPIAKAATICIMPVTMAQAAMM
jgi:hypothetical protein